MKPVGLEKRLPKSPWGFQCRNGIDSFSTHYHSESTNHSIAIFSEVIKPVVLNKYEFE